MSKINDGPAFYSDSPSKTNPVANPTWYADIRYMFTATDDAHMGNQGLDLTSYDAVVASASGIFAQVSADNMPPGDPWPQAWKDTFLNWIIANFPKGTQAPSVAKASGLGLAATHTASRVRKEITTLSPSELKTLKKAFQGIMDLDSTDPNSYFMQAATHWLPAPLDCQHHVPAYNPWHRAYLVSFENALRTVSGCADVTLPYWDVTTPFPDVLKSAPFDKYKLPEAIGGGFDKGYVTQRFPYDEIANNLQNLSVAEDLTRALTMNTWEGFHGGFDGATQNTIIMAHDGGHLSIGTTMENQNVAAFDPIFWFFHSNWDRLFWQWQQEMDATTLQGLLTTISGSDSGSRDIFTKPALQTIFMKPFAEQAPHLTTVDVIDSINNLDIDYEHPAIMVAGMKGSETKQFAPASEGFSVDPEMVNVHVGGVNRLNIPGSFKVHLLKDGEIISSRAVFQPVEPEQCENCKKNAIAGFDFELPLAAISGGKLSVKVEPVDKSFVGGKFPDKMMGNPTVDVHLRLRRD